MGAVSGIAWLGVLLLQAYLVTTTGQSIAKRWFRIKIVKVDGSPVNFVSGVLLRIAGTKVINLLGASKIKVA
jgi:uncharacterized RDD family membrane protein YckC